MRAAVLVLFINAVGLILFLQARAPKMLGAVVDPLHPDWQGMEIAFAGFVLYGVSLLALLGVGALALVRAVRRRVGPVSTESTRRRWIISATLAATLTALIVLVLVEVLVFQDYGIHFYEFSVVRILADAALRRDLGIQPVEILRVTLAAAALLAAELTLFLLALRAARWRDGALARACTVALLVSAPGGLVVFRSGEEQISSDRAEFEGALPLGKQLLMRNSPRPYISVAPRTGANGYPVLGATDAAPTLARKANIVFFVADGLRGDMFTPVLMPNLRQFTSRSDVVTSQRHLSTGHVSEAGVFGLVYGLSGQAFHSYVDQKVPSYPLTVLKRNGYHTFLLASSRLSPYPSNHLVQLFDEIAYPENDDEALVELRRYLEARRADGKPYFVLGFFYTPHYPFVSAKPHLRKFPMAGPKARSNYMNDVLQADDYFRQTVDLVGVASDSGRTLVVATADHGEEIRDHGVFGHASATFWNEKIVVPFAIRLPGHPVPASQRSPVLTSHADIWPTIFDYLGASPRLPDARYSDGRSLLRSPDSATQVVVTGRFFPHTDRPSVLVDSATKYWFRVAGVGANDRLCVVVTRVTDLEDKELGVAPSRIDARMVPAFERLQASFWRFIRPAQGATSSERAIC